jgi:hypothetical protein
MIWTGSNNNKNLSGKKDLLVYLHVTSSGAAPLQFRVARFFLTQCTKTEENYTKLPQHYQIATALPNGHKIYQMSIKHTSIFQSKALQNLPKSGFLV